MLADDIDALLHFAVSGLGITMAPDILVREEVARGELVRLTESHQVVPAEVFAVTEAGASNPRVAHLVEHIAAALADVVSPAG